MAKILNKEREKPQLPGRPEEYKFFLKVKPLVESIFIFSAEGQKYLGEMWTPQDEDLDYKIFNGTLPAGYPSREVKLVILGQGGETTYPFDSLFSIPLGDGNKKGSGSGTGLMKNCIVINTPETVKWVCVDVPAVFQEKLKLPSRIFPLPSQKPKMSNQELMARGIDPQGKTFIELVDCHVSEAIDEGLLKNVMFTVRCYGDITVLRYTVS